MSKSLVCFEIETEHLGALAPIFVYAENLHIEPVKDPIGVTKDPAHEALVSIATEVGLPGSTKRKHGDLSEAQIEARRKKRPDQPPVRSIHNPDARNYTKSIVQRTILRQMQRFPNSAQSYEQLRDALEQAGFSRKSLSPALSWLRREKYVTTIETDAMLTESGKNLQLDEG